MELDPALVVVVDTLEVVDVAFVVVLALEVVVLVDALVEVEVAWLVVAEEVVTLPVTPQPVTGLLPGNAAKVPPTASEMGQLMLQLVLGSLRPP